MTQRRSQANDTNLLKKGAATLLLFSFLFSPSVALAQETPVDTPAPDPVVQEEPPAPNLAPVEEPTPSEPEVTPTPEATPVYEEPTPEVPLEETPAEETTPETEVPPEPEALMAGGSSDTEQGSIFINNESTRSVVPGVDTQTGALTYAYGLVVPPGRNGMTPDLALVYNSGTTGNTSAFGYGWSTSIPYIQRMNKYGVDQMYGTTTTFYSSLDGELVRMSTTSTTYKPRVENGASRRYTLANNVWTVLEKDGKELAFGTTTNGRRNDSASTTRIYSWHLEESRDTNENYIEYTYFKDAGQIYPDTISYTGNGTTDGIFSITFTREARPDNLVSYDTGFAATTTYRTTRIETAVNGTWVGRYDLGYGTGHNGNRSLLTTILRSGQDELGGIETLPRVNLSYETYAASEKEWTEDAGWYVPVNIARDVEGYDDGARFVDINGDSLPDIIQSAGTEFNPNASSTISEAVYLHTGSAWATSTAWNIPAAGNGRFAFAGGFIEEAQQGNLDNGARFADVNRDGYTDILWAYQVDGQYGSPPNIIGYNYDIHEAWISNGTSTWATSSTWMMPSDVLFARKADDGGGRVVDINGDSLPDLVDNENIYLNTGAGWQSASTTWRSPEVIGPATVLTDVNGDGLTDVVRSYENDYSSGEADEHIVHLNTGAGWATSTSWNVPLSFYYTNTNNVGFAPSTQMVDINSDNLPDLIDNTKVYLNTGESWVEDVDWADPPYFKFGYTGGGSNYYYTSAGVANMDADGDNMIDFVKSGPLDSSPTYPHDKGVYIHDAKVPDLLREIEYPEGGDITATYKQSALYATGGNKMNSDSPFNLNTVETITYDDDETTPYVHTYTYGGGDLYFASSTDNQFAGFASTTKQDARGNVTKAYIHQGNGSQSSLGENADNFFKIGKPFLTELYNNSSNLYTRAIYRWENASTSTTTAFTYRTREVKQHYDGDVDHKDTAVEYIFSTTTGNIATTTEWGEVTGSADGSFSDTGSDKRVTGYAYATSTVAYLMSLPYQVTVNDQNNVKVRESRRYYDNQVLGNATLGNTTRKDEWATTTTYASTRITYNAYGLPLTESDPRYATTTYTYDTNNLYPKLVTNALSQTASSTYDYSLGKPKLTTDVNGYISEWVYDGLDRVLTEMRPDPDIGTRVTVREHEYTDQRNRFAVQTDTYLTAATSTASYRYFDGFGRKIQERIKAEDEDTYIVRDWIYGDDGLLAEESLPYFDQNTDQSDPTDENDLYTSYNYDALNRLTSAQNAVGQTDTAYDQWQEVVTDALDRDKTYGYDAYGRLVTVIENNGGSAYTTTYEWNHNDKLTKVTDALANIRNITYDGLGRRLTLQDLHDVADATFGTWQFTYDNASNVTQVTDPKSQVTQNTFDFLNRQLTENYTGVAGTEITFTYDSCTNGIGMLCTASSTGAMVANKYTPNGLLATTTETITGVNYITQYSYDRAGNQTVVTYPGNAAVRYVYNIGGQVETVETKEPNGAYTFLIRDFDYGPHGKVTYKEFANGVRSTYTYDPTALYRLITILTDN